MSNSFYDLATRLQEEGSTGPTSGGATTMDAISYLPTQVGVVRAALTGLGKKKRKWNMEILEGEGGRMVKFENALQITVPDEHWENFQQMFDGQLGSDSCFELPSTILDSSDLALDLEGEKATIHLAVESFFRCPEVQQVQRIYERWVSRFGIEKDLTPNRILLPIHKLIEGIEKVYQELVKPIEKDQGQLEMLSERIEEDPLPVFQGMGDYTILAGARIQSVFQGIRLVFEARLGFDRSLHFSILVEDDEVADRLQESLPFGVGRVGKVFYPSAAHFTYRNIPDLLVETIQDLKGGTHE